ncbi:cytochrome P450 [Solirubrobacter ginsenosidimutans]|uniref:Cytochrome P450 n=1 Tax=Solirubrobacter ginsenosidimutans TaxID=490573 RepID=A0A9X3MZ45_9ACTN|nr:cytochrome P450 [Solirubrobacter ginsenosidimutans]MDA0165651.1 cytochrome P450 [Solirubrobacter ginsenosidimutans]
MAAETRRLQAFPMSRAASCPFDPPPALRALQVASPLTRVRLWDDSIAWLVTRHAEQRKLLADPRLSADASHPHYPHRGPAQKELLAGERSFIVMDDPEHARMRRMLTAAFAIKRVETLRPAIQRIADRLIDDMLAGPPPLDLVTAFALPLPSSVICELLGVPYGDHEFFQANSRILLNNATTPQQARSARERLTDYLDGLLGQRLADPRGDLLSDLARHVNDGELTRHAAAVMASLLLVAGHETTANMIALGTLALLQHPEQVEALRATDDPALIAAAVEELLRYLSIVQSGRRRVALQDIPIAGQTIRAGEGVILATEAANRDASVFADPDRLDVHRDARGHMAFGFGVHQCLGQPLARVELQVALGTLFRRIPTLRPAVGLDGIPFKHDSLVYGVYELPVGW